MTKYLVCPHPFLAFPNAQVYSSQMHTNTPYPSHGHVPNTGCLLREKENEEGQEKLITALS